MEQRIEKEVQRQLNVIRRGTVEVISESKLAKKIERSLDSTTLKVRHPLRIKAGFDPSAPDLHLGHIVLLRKLRQFQDLGHKVLFLIGDFTALIGDPSGQNKTRPIMTHEEVDVNARTYLKQVSKVLNTQDNAVFELSRNSRWFGAGNIIGTLEGVLTELTSRYTVAQLLERDDFAKRFKANKPITMSELIYPLMQGYDSVQIRADVELGGTDQKFNLLVGREFQRLATPPQEPQVIITLPLLEGIDGVQKMSKSLGNAIGIQDQPKEMFGKLMSISDELMLRYYELLTDEDIEEIRRDLKRGVNPKELKCELALMITARFHDQGKAYQALDSFDRVFQKREIPEEIPSVKIRPDDHGKVDLPQLLIEARLATSMGQARRLIQQGAVKKNRTEKIREYRISLKAKDVLQVGPRRFVRIAS